MLIRTATPVDIPRLLPLIAEICALHEQWDAAKYGFLPHPERRYEGWLHRLINSQRDLCLVAEDTSEHHTTGSRLAGFLLATVEAEIPIYRVKEYGFIHDLWVEPEFRQTGIAKQLVQQTIAHFKQQGVAQIRLDTAAANETARQLFTGCGFRVSTIEMLLETEAAEP